MFVVLYTYSHLPIWKDSCLHTHDHRISYWLVDLIYFNIQEPEKWNCPSVRICHTEYLKWIKTINQMKTRNWNIPDRDSFKIWPNKGCIAILKKSSFAQAKYISTSFYTFIHTCTQATLHPYWCCQIVLHSHFQTSSYLSYNSYTLLSSSSMSVSLQVLCDHGSPQIYVFL